MTTDTLQMLDIACNMNKCKYELLRQTTDNFNARHTSVFISLETIMDMWLELCGSNQTTIVWNQISQYEIASKLFELIAHYKRYYAKIPGCDRLYIFLYYTTKVFQNYEYVFPLDGSVHGVNRAVNKYDDGFSFKMMDVIEVMKTICTYIPGIYMVDTENLPVSVFPYSISQEISYRCMSSSVEHPNMMWNQRVLVVSDNPLDYHAISAATGCNFSKGFVFRRKHAILYTVENMYDAHFFKHRVQKPSNQLTFADTYTLYLASLLPREEVPGLVGLSKEIKAGIKEIMFNPVGSSSDITSLVNILFINHDDWKELFLKNCQIVDIPTIFQVNAGTLNQMKLQWKHDRIDYSIEAMNEQWFKTCKIDFASLFLGA